MGGVGEMLIEEWKSGLKVADEGRVREKIVLRG